MSRTMNWTTTGQRLDERHAAKRRAQLRDRFRCWHNVPVIVGEVDAPQLIGERGGHFTRAGDRIAHPSAYSRRGWSSMTYRTDGRKIVVPPSMADVATE